MFLAIVLLPFLGFLFCALFGRYFGAKGSSYITTSMVGLSFLLSVLSFKFVALDQTVYVYNLGAWFASSLVFVNWSFMFDTLTVVMFIVVTSVSFLVHLYSIEYMEGDPFKVRFFSYLSLFTFFMLILVSAENLVQLFVGWEGVGVCSFLLINFWFSRFQANKSAIKAMVVNRIGDAALTIAIFISIYFFGTASFSEFPSIASHDHFLQYSSNNVIFAWLCGFNFDVAGLFGFCVFIGAVGKSAQLGLHTWLPDAMEGPTPVSALIHAATMVTAGVFLLIRCSEVLDLNTFLLDAIIFFGATTAFFAATAGAFQYDLKRIIAYSTCSQLGYMVFACGLSNYNLALFHLANHAFFKALLFLSAGSVIHAMNDEQDLRKMGGLVNILPITYIMFVIGSLSLAGFPFLTGFYSKDLILELSVSGASVFTLFAFILGLLGAFLTAFYSMRLVWLAFLSEPRGFRNVYMSAHEPSYIMLIPLLVLVLGAIFVGFVGKDMFVGLGSDFFGGVTIFNNEQFHSVFVSEFIPAVIKNIPFFVSMFGILLCILFFNDAVFKFFVALFLKQNLIRDLFSFFNKKWYFDVIYNKVIVYPVLKISYFGTFKAIDRGLLEIFGGYGFNRLFSSIFKFITALQSGYIYNYISFMIFGLVMFLSVVLFFNVTVFLLICLKLIFFSLVIITR